MMAALTMLIVNFYLMILFHNTVHSTFLRCNNHRGKKDEPNFSRNTMPLSLRPKIKSGGLDHVDSMYTQSDLTSLHNQRRKQVGEFKHRQVRDTASKDWKCRIPEAQMTVLSDPNHTSFVSTSLGYV